MTRILFSDGEGIDQSDFNLSREIFLRKLFDDLAMNLSGPDQVPWAPPSLARQTDSLRPMRNSGVMFGGTAGTTVDVNGGLWIHVDFGGVPSQDTPMASVANKTDIETITGFVAAAAGTFRRDIIQARMVDADDVAVSRDVEDAATRVVTSSSLVKRSRLSVEYQRKAGVQQASQALSDDPSNEATADVGWFKIGSVLVDQSGLMSHQTTAWDWRKPWGYSKALTPYSEFNWDTDTFTTFKYTGGTNYVTGDIGDLYATCPLARMHQGNDAFGEYAPFRIERIVTASNFISQPSDADVQIFESTLIAGIGTQWGTDLGANVGSGLSESTMVDSESQNIPPLWSTGTTNPWPSFENLLQLKVVTANVSDTIHGVQWRAWGGF